MDNTQVVIIGSGIAGSYAALKMAPYPTLLVTPSLVNNIGSSHYAQGGIAAAIGKNDSLAQHLQDTMIAGAGLVKQDAARSIIGQAASLVSDLESLGVCFDRDAHNAYQFSLEAGHCCPRVLHLQGDSSGANMMRVLTQAVRQSSHIRVIDNHHAVSLAKHDGVCVGVWIADNKGAISYLPAPSVVLATGGIGALFTCTTNPPQILGQGIGMAARAGAVIMNPEFMQFHPTALKTKHYPTPLVTEALRGAGAKLVNQHQQCFMDEVHPLGDLAPRDIVARAIYRQLTNGNAVYLDARESLGECLAKDFPTVYAACIKEGIDPHVDLIPVTPAAHYHVGGIMTNIHGQSSIQGLYACGEVACTGLHGANRLASNSLLEGLVMAENMTNKIKSQIHNPPLNMKSAQPTPRLAPTHQTLATSAIWKNIREVIENSLGIIRHEKSLHQGIERIQSILMHHTADLFLANSCISLLSALFGAMYREESRGCHYREDYPETSVRCQFDTKLMMSREGFFNKIL